MEGFVLRTGTKFLLSFALFGAILGVGTRTSAAESVKISYSAISWLMTPVWMAEELGLFKKNGLDAQLIYAILGFAGMKDVDVDEVTAKVIDNSVLDTLQREKFFEKLFAKTK